MKKIERIVVSAVVHSTENPEKVGKALSLLFPFEFIMQKVILEILLNT